MRDLRNLTIGGLLQAVEAATFGLPLEVMKTRQGSHPEENVFQAFRALKSEGYRAFWKGLDVKVTESLLKGGVFLMAREQLVLATDRLTPYKDGTGVNGAIAGAGAGVVQTIVMAPLTFIITARVKNKELHGMSTYAVFQRYGIKGVYNGASAVALRQASNWGLRQGLVQWANNKYEQKKGGKLNSAERVACGLFGGALAAANQPIEVLRIRMQSQTSSGVKNVTLVSTSKLIWREQGFMGFWVGIIPRMGLSAYQSLFMITVAAMVKEQLKKAGIA